MPPLRAETLATLWWVGGPKLIDANTGLAGLAKSGRVAWGIRVALSMGESWELRSGGELSVVASVSSAGVD